jgi:hypothetical protein
MKAEGSFPHFIYQRTCTSTKFISATPATVRLHYSDSTQWELFSCSSFKCVQIVVNKFLILRHLIVRTSRALWLLECKVSFGKLKRVCLLNSFQSMRSLQDLLSLYFTVTDLQSHIQPNVSFKIFFISVDKVRNYKGRFRICKFKYVFIFQLQSKEIRE